MGEAGGDDTSRGGGRIIGYDVARALALLGMIVVHFGLVAGVEREGRGWAARTLAVLDGRAAAVFMVLAGVGITLMSRGAVARGEAAELVAVRRRIARRGVFLLVLGYVNLVVWPGDILRVYGVSLLLAAGMVRASGRALLGVAGGLAAAFAVLVVVGDFDRNWDWRTLTYHGLWTPAGVVRNLFYDGFRSVLPWTRFLLFGMWLGRLELAERRVNGRVLWAAAAVTVVAEVVSRVLVRRLRGAAGLSAEDAAALFGTESMPAMPLFLLAAGGAAVVVIVVCVRVARSRAWRPLAAAGRMALTWYVAHIVVGLGGLVALGKVSTEPLSVAIGYGVGFFVVVMIVSWGWMRRFRNGPLEWVMRKVAG